MKFISLEPFTEDQGRSAVQPTRGSHQSASLCLTDLPPHPNSPHDNVFRPDRPIAVGLGSKNRGCAASF
ncbi:hypothetical protein Lal_00041034 [Lupinus albus]|nr:hypothetical protein Lal_00041034 [Lupinus albus]